MKSNPEIETFLEALADAAESAAHQWLCGDVCRCGESAAAFRDAARSILDDYEVAEIGVAPVRRGVEEE